MAEGVQQSRWRRGGLVFKKKKREEEGGLTWGWRAPFGSQE